MSPANWLVLAMAVQCAIACALYVAESRWPHAVMFAGYTVANAGIIWAAIK